MRYSNMGVNSYFCIANFVCLNKKCVMEKNYIKLDNKRGIVYTEDNIFVELRLNKKIYRDSAAFIEDFNDKALTSSNDELLDILSAAGFNTIKSSRKRIPWRLYIEPVFLDKIDDYAKNNYPLNRSDVVNLAISSTLTTIKGGYASKRGVKKDNVCFNIEKEFAEKISAMANTDTKNSILLACLYEYFK